jgi:hypothetical protein
MLGRFYDLSLSNNSSNVNNSEVGDRMNLSLTFFCLSTICFTVTVSLLGSRYAVVPSDWR